MITENLPQNNPPQEFTENKSLINVPELPAERKMIENSIDLQLEYLNIHRTKIMRHLTFQELAKEMGISIGKAKMACHWVRKNWEILGNDEYIADAEALISDRILELDRVIEEIKQGEVILAWGAPIMVGGAALKKVKKLELLKAINERREYEKLRMDIQGIIKRANILKVNDVNVTNYNLQNKIAIFDKMSHEDKEAFLSLIGKYAQPPTRN
jgi:hypothetical protein